MKQRYFYTLITAFVLLLLVQLLSGVVLFVLKFGFTPDLLHEYFVGNEDKYMLAKSFCGLLKTAFIHFFAYGVILFIVSHFVMMVRGIAERKKMRLIIVTSLSGLIDIMSNFLIQYEMTFVYIKMLSFVLFELGIVTMLFIILKSTLIKKHP
jgi:hypothetical protein